MNPTETGTDQVVLKGVQFEAVVGLDQWHRPGKIQPVELELHLTPPGGLEAAAQEDDVAYTIDYGSVYKKLKATVTNGNFASVTHLYEAIRAILPETVSWHISINLPKGILEANGGIQISWTGKVEPGGLSSVTQVMTIRDVECRCIIGVNSNERLEKQQLRISVMIWGIENRLSPGMLAGVSLQPAPTVPYQKMVKDMVERVEGSSYETIEALATAIVQIATLNHGFDNARVSIEKPGGVGGFGASGVSIGRTKAYFENKDFWKVKRP